MTLEEQQDIFERAEQLLGSEAMECIARQRVILFGVGGVGSWCAEALVRSGVGHLTIVDGDVVCASNINRQLMATTETIGQPKVEVLRQRLLAINPNAEITALRQVFSDDTADEFGLADYDYIIDAIDSLKDKALLILKACETRGVLFSSMGAALKVDAASIKVAEFWRVQGDPLARGLRKWLKSHGRFPERKFQCVYSDEMPAKAQTKGSVVHITAVFGLRLAGLVINDICSK